MNFLTYFQQLLKKNFPLTKTRKSRMQIDRCKKSLNNQKYYLSQLGKRINSIRNFYVTLQLTMNTNTNNIKINCIIKIAKKKYYEEQLVKYKNETKLLWSTLNEIMNKANAEK